MAAVTIWLWRQARRIAIFVIGSTVLLVGIAMIVLPGPAVVVIPLGLAILATEFIWAKRCLEYAKRRLEALRPRSHVTPEIGSIQDDASKTQDCGQCD